MNIPFIHNLNSEDFPNQINRVDDLEYVITLLRNVLKSGQTVTITYDDGSTTTFNPNMVAK